MARNFGRGKWRQRLELSPGQRAAGILVAVLLIIQTPTYEFHVEYDDNTVRTVQLSPLETTALGLLTTDERVAEYVPYLLLPGTWYKVAVAASLQCWLPGSAEKVCDFSTLTDLPALLREADYRDKVKVFVEQSGHDRQLLQAAAAMATVFSLTCPILDGTTGLMIGYGGMAFLANKAGFTILVQVNVWLSLAIAVYVIMSYSEDEKARLKKKRADDKEKRKEAKEAAQAAKEAAQAAKEAAQAAKEAAADKKEQ